jgi:hypothetical protein
LNPKFPLTQFTDLNAGGPGINQCDLYSSNFNRTLADFSIRISEIKKGGMDTIIAYERNNATEDYLGFENTLRNLTRFFVKEINDGVSDVIDSIVLLIPGVAHDDVKYCLVHDIVGPYPLSCLENLQNVVKISDRAIKAMTDQAFVAIDSHDY